MQIAGLEQQQRQLDEMLENLAAGRRADPADVAAFRHALSSAGIAHDLLTDLVEIADPSWQAAVEAVLAPFAHIVLLAKDKDAEAAMALGEKLRYRHFIVPERTQPGLAPQGSLLEMVRFTQPVPEWLLRLLERIRRVEDASAGAKLPARRGLDHPPGILARAARRAFCRTGTGAFRARRGWNRCASNAPIWKSTGSAAPATQ